MEFVRFFNRIFINKYVYHVWMLQLVTQMRMFEYKMRMLEYDFRLSIIRFATFCNSFILRIAIDEQGNDWLT